MRTGEGFDRHRTRGWVEGLQFRVQIVEEELVQRMLRWIVILALLTASAAAQSRKTPEERTAAYLQSIRTQPLLALAFLREMPKGGDLHNHLSGSVYAESYLRWAAADGSCLRLDSLAIVAPPCNVQTGVPPATAAFADMTLYSRAIDAMSMRNW